MVLSALDFAFLVSSKVSRHCPSSLEELWSSHVVGLVVGMCLFDFWADFQCFAILCLGFCGVTFLQNFMACVVSRHEL